MVFISTSAFVCAQVSKGVIADDSSSTPAIGKTRALVVGISKYQYINPLNYADKDAEEFSRFLSANRFWNIPSEDIKLLTNENAKCGDIIAELSRIIQVSKPGDRVIFYFSGHGDIETITQFNNGYLLTYDTYKNNYITGAVAVNFLKEVFLTLLNKDVKVLMFTDACRSGNLAGGLKGTEFATAAISSMWKNEIKILSSQPGQLSYEDKKWGNGRGVFSYYLTQGLAGAADDNKDSLITLSELEMYVGKNVAAATDNRQQPVFEGPNKFSTVVSKVFANTSSKGKPGGSIYTKKIRHYNFDMDSCTIYYKLFNEAATNNILINNPASATSYYKKLRSCSNDVDLVLRANSKLIALLMDNTQQIVNNSLVGKKLVDEKTYEYGIQLMDQVLQNNDLKIPDTHFKNLRRYLFVSNQVTWNTSENKNAFPLYHTIIDSALRDEPGAAYLLNVKGTIYIRMNETAKAINNLEKALQNSPTWLMPKYFLGLTYSKEKNYEKALKYYEEVLAKDSSYKTFECTKCILQEMADLSEKLKDQNKAIKYYNKNFDLFPDFTPTYSGLSQLIIRTNNKKAAGDFINKLYKYNDSVFARVTRIELMMQFDKKDWNKIEESIDSVDAIVKDRVDSADVESLRGKFYSDIFYNYDEAIDHFTNAANLVPDDIYYMHGLINFLEVHGRYEEIEKLVKEKISNYSKEDQPELRNTLALSLLAQNKLREAFKEYKALHESQDISCDELKKLNKYLNKLPEYNQYVKNCKDSKSP